MNKKQLTYLEEKYNIKIPLNDLNQLSNVESDFVYELYKENSVSFAQILNIISTLSCSHFAYSNSIEVLAIAFKIGKFDKVLSLILLTRCNPIGTICKNLLDKYQR